MRLHSTSFQAQACMGGNKCKLLQEGGSVKVFGEIQRRFSIRSRGILSLVTPIKPNSVYICPCFQIILLWAEQIFDLKNSPPERAGPKPSEKEKERERERSQEKTPVFKNYRLSLEMRKNSISMTQEFYVFNISFTSCKSTLSKHIILWKPQII